MAISLISIPVALTVAQRQLNYKLAYLFDKYMPPSTIKNNTNLCHQVLFFFNAVANKHHHTEQRNGRTYQTLLELGKEWVAAAYATT